MSNKPDEIRSPADARPISRWGQELLHGSVPERQAAADSLGEVRPLPHAAIEAFVQALGDRDPSVASRAARTLRALGPEAIQPLLDALRNPVAERAVLKAVAQTLAALKPGSEVLRLVKELLCGDSHAQCAAAESLGGLRREARDAIPALVWSMRNGQNANLREAATRSLGDLGPLTPEVIPALVQVLEGDHGPAAVPRRAAHSKSHADAGRMAAETLGRIGTPEAIAALLRVLRGHPDADVKRLVAESLGALVPPVPRVVRPLVEALNDASPAVREAATQALIAIGGEAVAELTAALRRDPLEVRRHAAVALERLAPGSWGAIDALALALADDDTVVVVHAAVALVKIFEANAFVRLSGQQKRGQSPNGYVPENERALVVLAGIVRRKEGERRDRQQAAEALGRIGVGARPALRTLADVSADASEDRLVRGSAWWALQRLAPEEAGKLKAP